MNTQVVKSAAVKALALGAMLMSTPVQAADYYVAKTGSDGNPGTQGAPFATIGKAITEANTAIDGGADSATIYVGDGTYAEHTLTLEKPITIVGESGDRDAVIVNANGSASNKRRAFTLNHAAATVSGITVRGGYINLSGNNQGGNILISANGGVVTNCVVASGFASGGGNIRLSSDDALVIDCVVANGTIDYSWGGNIAAVRGHVSRCLVANGTANGSVEPAGDSGNVYLGNSAVMENCLVRGGVVKKNSEKNANGVYLAGSSRLVNCTIVKNRSDSYPNVPAVNAGADTVRVVNCVIYGNGGTAAKEWGGANGACYVNCATASGAAITGGTGNIATLTDAAFADYANGDYCPAKRGVLVNVGASWADYLAYGAASTLDLAGAARFYGGGLDIGCYESDSSDSASFTLPDYYVAKTGDDDNDGTQASPFATIGMAIAAANATIAGGAAAAVTVHVGDGTYAEHTLTLEKPITIVGESGNRDAVIVNANGSNANRRRAFTLNHAAATVSGITVKNGYVDGGGITACGGNVLIDENGGVVTNCVVLNGYAVGGGNIYMNGEAALVLECVVTNGTVNWSRGGNIAAAYGRVSRCLVANGTSLANYGGNPSGDSGNVHLGNSAVMENCLIFGGVVKDNNASNANGVYLADSSRLVNCTIVKNRADSYANVPAVNASTSTVRVVGCVLYGNGGTAAREWGSANGACYVNCATASGAAITGGTGNIATVTDAAFADYANGDYRPAAGGVLVNAATTWSDYLSYGAVSTLDLAGAARLNDGGLDIGCYEFSLSLSSYVQNGLVAQWDGIDNGGVGVHVDVATSGWTDLKGGVVLTKNGGEPVTDATGVLLGNTVKLQVYDSDANGPVTALGRVLGHQVKTVEIAGRDCNGLPVVQNFFITAMAGSEWTQYSTRLFMWYTDVNLPVLGSLGLPSGNGFQFYTGNDFGLTAGQDFTAAAVFASSTECRRYSNGMPRGTLTVSATERSSGNSAAISLHGWYGRDGVSVPPIYVSAVRVYNRALTAAEVKQNNLVDALRFGRARYHDGKLQYRVKASADDEAARVSAGGETGASASAWVDQGSNAVLNVVQVPSGKAFYCWGIGSGKMYDEELTVTATNPVDAVAHFAVKNWTYANGELTNGDWTFAASGANDSIIVGLPSTEGANGTVDLTGEISVAGGGTGSIAGFVDEMFKDNTALEVLAVPTSVRSIPPRFARNCVNLGRVVLHNEITNISHRAFRGLTKCSSFMPLLPPKLQSLGVYVFQASPLITTPPVFIPRTLTTCTEDEGDWRTSAYFDQAGFAEFQIEAGASLPKRLISGAVASIREVKFLGNATWVTGSGDDSSFKFDSSRDKRVRMSMPQTTAWKSWMEDTANVTPWAQCSSEDRETYFDEFGAEAGVPYGLTTAAATCRGMWVVPQRPTGSVYYIR